MHVFAILLFLGALVLALGVIRDMLVTHGEQIITALIGERVFPRHIVNVVNFQSRSHRETANRRYKKAGAEMTRVPPLALAA